MVLDYPQIYGEKAPEPTEPASSSSPAPVRIVLDKTLPLVEQARALTQETLDAARTIMNDLEEPAGARLAAAVFIKEIGHGKASADAPPLPDSREKKEVTNRLLSLLTDAQLDELRTFHD
jgi:hypothetical protein